MQCRARTHVLCAAACDLLPFILPTAVLCSRPPGNHIFCPVRANARRVRPSVSTRRHAASPPRRRHTMPTPTLRRCRPSVQKRKSSLIQQLMPKFSRSSVVSSPDMEASGGGRRSLAFSESLTESSKRFMGFGAKSSVISPGEEEEGGGFSRRFSRGISFSRGKEADIAEG